MRMRLSNLDRGKMSNDRVSSFTQVSHSLNMVVGANGTGKSSILNAICLGLGGEPKVLGRADDARAFIRHGASEASIEIELAPFPGKTADVLIRRIFRNRGSEKGRGRGASTFYLNGEKTSIQEIQRLVQGTYHIQIANLCTFLPQDKVGSFSGLSDQLRLHETEKTLSGSVSLYETHLELIDKEKDLSSDVGNLESIKDDLAKKQQELERIGRAKGLEEERLQVQAQIELLGKKKLWLEFEDIRQQAIVIREEKKAVRDQALVAVKEQEPLEENVEKLTSDCKKLKGKNAQHQNELKKIKEEMTKQEGKYSTHEDGFEGDKTEFLAIDSSRKQTETERAQAQSSLEGYKKTLADLPDFGTLTEEFSKCKEEVRATKKELDQAKIDQSKLKRAVQAEEKRAGELQHKVASLSNDGAQRRKKILLADRNAARVCQWLEQNRGLFRRQVWGPVAAEISPKSNNTAAFVEFHVPNRLLSAFVVETKADSDTLYREIREKQGIAINVLCVEKVQSDPRRMFSDRKMDMLKNEHGVACYLDETFSAPEPVMVALKLFASVDRAVVGSEKTQQSIDNRGLRDILSEPEDGSGRKKASCIFTAKGNKSYRYIQTVSEYSGKVASREDDVKPARMLAPGVRPEVKQAAEDELAKVHESLDEKRPELSSLDQRIKELETQFQEVTLRSKGAKGKIDAFNKLNRKAEKAEGLIRECERKLEKDGIDEKKKLVKRLLRRYESSLGALVEHIAQHDKMMEHTVNISGIDVTQRFLQSAKEAAE